MTEPTLQVLANAVVRLGLDCADAMGRGDTPRGRRLAEIIGDLYGAYPGLRAAVEREIRVGEAAP